jgi:hypothetical protein
MNDPAADYMQTHDYWTQGYSDSAFTLLNSMVSKYKIDTVHDGSYLTFKGYLQFRELLRDSGMSISHLDSAHLSSLNYIAVHGKGMAARSAKAIMHFFYDYPYETQLQIPSAAGGVTRMMKIPPVDSSATATAPTGYLKVYPNPTTGLEYFLFQLPCTDADGLLVVADMLGHTMYSSMVSNAATLATVNTGTWSNGPYLYRLTCNDKVVGAGKFEVIR